MLLVNNRLIDETRKGDPAVDYYIKEKAKIQKLTEPVIIENY